jgi:diguanylate cyclase (GGDEF)-like protein
VQSSLSTVDRSGAVTLSDARTLANDGFFETALDLAKRRSVACIRAGLSDDALRALDLAAEILCTLNQPLRAHAFTLEALEMAQTSRDAVLRQRARARGVLALLRLGEIDKAEIELRDIESPQRDADPLGLLVRAEVALATDEIREARELAERAFIAEIVGDLAYRARAKLILGVCAIREHAYKGALRPLLAAVGELQREPHAETFWQVHAALANVSHKLGRTEHASRYSGLAAGAAQRAADALSPALRERFLGNPTVQAALGAESERTGWSRVPPKVASLALAGEEPDGREALGPFLAAFRRLNEKRTSRDLVPVIVELMIELTSAQRGTIAIFDGDVCSEEVSRAERAQGFQPFEMSVARAVVRIVLETGRPFLADDIRTSPALDVRADRLLSVLCVPLRVKEKVVGAVYLDAPGASGAFEARDLEVAELLAHHGSVALENVHVHEHAIRDGLTLLFNQSHVEECLEREIVAARRDGRQCGVLMIDIDDFKGTNDGMGHAAGNDLLRALAPMLSGAVRSIDVVARIEARDSHAIVARYGGDEFEIVLPDTGPDGMAAVAARVLDAVRVKSFPHEEKKSNVTVSIGGACFPGDASTARELMERADVALYQAKQAGKNRYRAYSDA